MSAAEKSEEAKRKLIEAAGEVFADVGYEAATVRQITDKAQVNIAAVNYHFGDKFQLYRAVLETVTGRVNRLFELHCKEGSAKERLRQFVRGILLTESGGDYAWAHLLIARELVELHGAQADVVVNATRPMHRMAESIVQALAGTPVPAARVKLAASLVVSLCVNRIPQQRLDRRLSPEVDFEANDLEQVCDQVYRFALAGVRAVL